MFAAERFLALIAAVGLVAVTVALLAVKTAFLTALALVAGAIALLWEPRRALLVVAGLAPMGAAIRVVIGWPLEWTDVLLLSAMAAWAARVGTGRTEVADRWFAIGVVGLCATALASAVALTIAEIVAPMPAALDAAAWAATVAQLDTWGSPLRLALRLSAGAGTAMWIASEVRAASDRRSAAAMLLVAVSGIAVLSLYRLAEVALRSPEPLARAFEVARSARLVTVIGDPNALGALFLLLTPVAFDWCLTRGRRGPGTVALVVLLAGAWLAGSRTTMAVTPLSLVAVLVLRAGPDTRRRAVTGSAIILLAAAALVVFYPGGRRHSDPGPAWTVRRDMGTVTMRMLRDAPISGVGIGQFHRRSTEYMPPSLRQYYAAENAHNQFFQVAGELGLVGFAWFLGVLALAVAPGLRLARDSETVGLMAGIVAFLAASIGQHPLLDSQVASAFWIALGLLRSAGVGWPAWRAAGRPARALVAAAAVIVVATPAMAVVRIGEVDLSRVVNGTRGGLTDPNGPVPFRSTSLAATLYLPGDAGRCGLPLRARGVRGDSEVGLSLDGRPAGFVTAVRGQWRDTIIPLPQRPRWPYRFHRLDLEWRVSESTGPRALDVGLARCQ